MSENHAHGNRGADGPNNGTDGGLIFSANGVWPLRLNNPFAGRVVDYPDLGERTSVYRCLVCRQPVNARDLGQVFHHETFSHQPIPPQLVCTRP